MKYEDRRREIAESLAAKAILSDPIFSIGHEDFIINTKTMIIEWHLAGYPKKRGASWLALSNATIEDCSNLITLAKNELAIRTRSLIAHALLSRFYLQGPKGHLPD